MAAKIIDRVKEIFDNRKMKDNDGETVVVSIIKNVLEYENLESNLRPISLVKVIPKIALSIIANRWRDIELEMTNYGFRKETGTTQAVL